MTRFAIVSACLLALVCGRTAISQETGLSQERLQQLLKQFPQADANQDGTLTAEEVRAFREQTRRREAAKSAPRRELPAPTHADVHYGPHERQVLDFYQCNSEKPAPLIVYIHGGGFVAGDKRTISPELLRDALAAGISFAAIHYRFVDGRNVIFPAPQQDGARAVQFLRSKAPDWKLDPGKVACYGGSAGAGISMWIGFHDDLANPASDDPVARQSTRIQAIGTFGGQGTYDPIKIKELIGGRAWEHPSLLKVYGLTTTEQALNPDGPMRKLYDEASAITHLTADDPSLYMVYNEADGPLPADARPGQGIHHPNFGRQLKTEMDKLKVANTFVYTPQAAGRNPNREMLEFFQERFAAANN